MDYNSKQEVKFVEQCTRDEFKTEHDCYNLCDMLRNFYEIMSLRKLCELYELCELLNCENKFKKKIVLNHFKLVLKHSFN